MTGNYRFLNPFLRRGVIRASFAYHWLCMAARQSVFGIRLQSSYQLDSPLNFELECKWWLLKIIGIWLTLLASTDAFIPGASFAYDLLHMAVRQSVFGIGLWSSHQLDSPLSFELECKWWLLKILGIWLPLLASTDAFIPGASLERHFGRGCTNRNLW